MAERIGLEAVLDDKDFQKGLKNYTSGLDKAESKTQSVSSRLGSALGTGIKAGALGLAAGVGILGGALATTIGPASDLNETISKVGVVFGDQSDQVLKFGESAATSLGMSKNEALSAAGTYGNLFRSMGMTNTASADMSTELVGLAADLASFNNMEPTEVLDKLRAGLTGETEPLKSLGVNLSAAAIEAKAMEMGLMGADGQLSASAKAQASYALIMEQTKLAQGDFARTSDGLANRQRILGATFGDLKSTIGTALLPVVNDLAGSFLSFAKSPEFQAFIQRVTTEYIPKLVEGFRMVIGWLQDNWPTISAIISTAADIIGRVIGFIVTNVLPPLIAVLREIVNWVVANWPQIQATIQNVIQTIVDKFNAFKGDLRATIQFWQDKLNEAKGFLAATAQFWTDKFNELKGKLDATVQWWRDTIASWQQKLTEIQTAIKTTFEDIKTKIDTAVSGIVITLSEKWTAITSTVKTTWENIKKLITDPIDEAKRLVGQLIEDIKGFFSGLAGFHIPTPHFSLTTETKEILGLQVPVPKLDIAWYKKGLDAIISKPTLIGVGEAGAERVQVTPLGQQRMTAPASTYNNSTVNNYFTLSPLYTQYESVASLRDTVRLLEAGL